MSEGGLAFAATVFFADVEGEAVDIADAGLDLPMSPGSEVNSL